MGKQLVIVGADFSAVAIDTGPRYQIRGVITNGILTGRTSVVAGGSATVTITPNSGFTYPASVNDINVTGATKGTYDVASGQLNISNATGDVTIAATCPQGSVTTYTVQATVSNGTISPASVTVATGGNAQFTVNPTSGYAVSASDISITSGSGNCGTPTVSGTTVTVPNVTGNVTIAVNCHQSGGEQHLTTTWTTSQTISDQGKVGGGTRCCSAYVDLSGYSDNSYIVLPGSSANGCGLGCYNSNVSASGSTTEFLGFLKDDKSLIGVNTSGHRWVVDSSHITLSFLRSLPHDGSSSGQVNGIVFMCYANTVPSDYDIVVYS